MILFLKRFLEMRKIRNFFNTKADSKEILKHMAESKKDIKKAVELL